MRSDKATLRQASAALVCLLSSTTLMAGPSGSKGPKVPEQFANEDAVILEWDDTVEIGTDGSSTWHQKKHVLIQNDRAISAFADPRITYNKDYQKVKIVVARTVCPDGRIVEVPAYARNEVSPRETAGWPAFASIRQLVISFSAIEPGAIVELEWEMTTKPGMHECNEFEFPKKTVYPILTRRIQVPGAAPILLKDVAAEPDEPQGLPARDRYAWHCYSSCASDSAAAVARKLQHIEAAAKPVDALKSAVEEWCAGESDPLDKAAEIQQKLASQFNFVELPEAWMPDALRPADQVMASHYGRPAEAAALLLALLRAAGLAAEPFFAIESISAPAIATAISAYGVSVKTRSGVSYWHASQGRIHDPGPWGGWQRYDKSIAASVDQATAAKFLLPDESRIDASAVVTVDDKAGYIAKLDLKLSGLFLNSTLRTDDEKKTAINAVLSRLLPDAELGKFTVTSLSDDLFAVTAEAKSTKPLQSVAGGYALTLPQDAPWTNRFSFPMGRSQRKTTLRLPGPFEQNINLELKLPPGWSLAAYPKELDHELDKTAVVRQKVDSSKERMLLHATTAVLTRDISPSVYPQLRAALSEAQAERARTMILKSAAQKVK